jgi:hypothetical protein
VPEYEQVLRAAFGRVTVQELPVVRGAPDVVYVALR